jgi:hypothetical protein
MYVETAQLRCVDSCDLTKAGMAGGELVTVMYDYEKQVSLQSGYCRVVHVHEQGEVEDAYLETRCIHRISSSEAPLKPRRHPFGFGINCLELALAPRAIHSASLI